MSQALDDFGQLVTAARDGALDRLEWLFDGRARAPALQQLSANMRAMCDQDRDIVRLAVRESVDDAIHGLLFALYSDDRVGLVFDGVDLRQTSDGLHGDYVTEHGWQGRFSKYPPIS